MNHLSGMVIGDYRFLRQLGTGSLADVYLVEDTVAKGFYALKFYTCPGSDIRSHNEGTILEKVSHPNIIGFKRSVLLSYQNDMHQKIQLHSLILEYSEKGDLYEFVAKSGRFDENTCRYYFKQLTKGLSHIHNKGLSHRNLKLESILVDQQYDLKICNFSQTQYLNKYKDGKLRTKVGTKSYSAPELLLGSQYNGVLIDIFSLGVILFILYKGSPPFVKAAQSDPFYNLLINKNFQEFWDNHSQQSKIDFPIDFKELFQSLVHPNPEQRPTMDKIEMSKWYNGPIKTQQEIYIEMNKRDNIIHQ